MENRKCNKSCEDCTFPCCKSGENLMPITCQELEEMGYVICEDFTTIPIESQDK